MSPSLRPVNVIVLVLVGAVGGGLSGAWLGSELRSQSALDAGDSKEAETLAALRNVSAALVRTSESMAALTRSIEARPVDAQRAPTAEPVARDEVGLQEQLVRLNEGLRALAEQLARSTPGESGLRLEPRDVPDSVFSELAAKDEARLKLEHFGWTPQMVFDAYGEPQDIGPSPTGGGAKWYYNRPGTKRIVFWFTDNRVSSVFAH